MGVAAIFCILLTHFHFLVPKSLNKKLIKYGPVVSYVNDLGPRSRNDIDLQYSHTFITSISCLHLPAFRSQPAIVSEHSIVFTFFLMKSLSYKI